MDSTTHWSEISKLSTYNITMTRAPTRGRSGLGPPPPAPGVALAKIPKFVAKVEVSSRGRLSPLPIVTEAKENVIDALARQGPAGRVDGGLGRELVVKVGKVVLALQQR